MSSLDKSQAARVELAKRELARRSFFDFVPYVFPNYQMKWFHKVICEKLEMVRERKIKKLMIFVPPQHGKLLPIDTPVFTPNGWVKHGDLSVGDYVFGHDGKQKRVIANSGTYTWNVDRINIQGGLSILAAKEHEWVLECDHDDHKGRVCKTYETQHIFSRRHRRNPAIRLAGALETSHRDLPIDPYLFGCWLGDGFKELGGLTVGREDIEYFKDLGNAREVRPGIFRVIIPGLTTKLRALGVLRNKHIPIQYLTASEEQRWALLRGLMDTDGCVDFRGRCEFTQKDNQLVKQVYTLIRTLGIKCSNNSYGATIKGINVGRKVRLTFSPSKGMEVFQLPRKREKLLNKSKSERDDKNKFFIESVVPHGFVEGNCIQVEGGVYLAGEDLIPTHNSQLATRLFPAYTLGRNPNEKIAIASYSARLSMSFSRASQRTVSDRLYHNIFPDIRLPERGEGSKTAEFFEIIGGTGSLMSVGVEGSLTGSPVDIGIIDDPVKDRQDAQSITIRESTWSWYIDVFKTRLHNDSVQLIIQTRWHEDDLSGRILAQDGYYSADNPNGWQVVKFTGLRTDDQNDYDPREVGEALWPERHSRERLEDVKSKNILTFDSLYQQDPKPSKESLVFPEWIEIPEFPECDVVFYGLDFGFTNDPTALIRIGKSGNNIYLDELIYERGLTNTDIRLKAKAMGVGQYEIFCDSAEAKSIEELKRPKDEFGKYVREGGINALPAVKGKDSVNAGISLLKEYKVHYTSRSLNLKKEKNNYSWIMAGGVNTNVPIDAYNHAIDAVRYGVYTKYSKIKVTWEEW